MNQPTTPPTAPHTSVDWGLASRSSALPTASSPHERGLGDSRLVHAAGGNHVLEHGAQNEDDGHDGENDPRGAGAGHPRPHEDRASDDGCGGPDLHDRADHSDEDDDANDDGSEDAHGAIIRAGLTTIKKAATNFDYLCYF